jgi:predicted nucleotidyltransferase
MPSVSTHEPDDERARRVAEDGCVLRALVGSTVHGLTNQGTDDRDEMAVCVEPPEYILGLRPFEHYVFRTQPEGQPSGPGDLDLVVYGLRKYVRLASKGSPTVLLLLFAPPEHTLVETTIGRRLRSLAPAFISARTARAFLGYLSSQRAGLLAGPAGEGSGSRARERSARHGYDTKYAMHALRIAHQGLELIEHGRITLPVPEPVNSQLMEVRRGDTPLEEIVAEIERLEAELEVAATSANLPPQADADAIDAFLIDAYEQAWAEQRHPA